ncbi:MAG TPA: thiosulfate oxidation carrier protein SoxY [Acidiferrobacteraceae bacterium]|nr:thiosulfate oxidation carrier protein SoxY [Acidiferrobacteraceae bacterium]
MKRRAFLKGSMAGSVLAIAVGAGLLRPTQVMASQWPDKAFKARNLADAVNSLYGSSDVADSKAIKIRAPLQAENGAKVPIQILTDLPAESIAVFVKENAMPLAGRANLRNASGFFSTRIKMGKSSDVVAVIKSKGKLHSTKLAIKVTVGGCGG